MASTNQYSHHVTSSRTLAQKVCIGMGIVFVLAGLAGIVRPGLFDLHLSWLHNAIHLLSGAIALWAGYGDDPRRAHNFAIAFGVVYALLGLAGFIFGELGVPHVGNIESDPNVLRIIPGALVLATEDHILHVVLGGVFLITAFVSQRTQDATNLEYRNRNSDTVTNSYFETNDSLPNSESTLKDASLGRSDINRKVDQNRRSDYERRI